MKFALLQRLVINTVFFLVISWVLYFYVYWQIVEFEEMKEQLHDTFEEYQDIKQSWISESTMRRLALSSAGTDEFYLRNILSNITPEFYHEHFSNTSDSTYMQFLADKSREIDQLKSSESLLERDVTIDKILPVYSPNLTITERDISTAEFINNIENLLHSFSLTHNWEIWITNIQLVSSWDGTESEQALAENIFQIPVSLTVEGMKWNIINFLHYISYVGWVTPDYENNTLIPHNDSFLWGGSETDLFSESRYLWQIASIQNISFNEYIDSSTSQQNDDFFTRIRSPAQFRERYQVRLDVHFYVAWYPQFRVIETINDLFDEIEEDLGEMEELLKRAEENFSPGESSRIARHRVAARIVSRLSDELIELRNPNIEGLAESEMLELLEALQRLQNIKNITLQDYSTFF